MNKEELLKFNENLKALTNIAYSLDEKIDNVMIAFLSCKENLKPKEKENV
jgi:hypothetical protein